MNLKKTAVLSGFAIVMMVIAQTVFAQEAAVAPVDPVVPVSNQEAASQKESDMQWAWGEVMNLDNQAKTVTLKYFDYETDQEKELVLLVDEKTIFENINDFNELKLKDTLSIDYMIGTDNKNIAKNISFEKPNVPSSTLVPVVENSKPVTLPSITGQSVVDVSQPAVPLEAPASDLAQPATQSGIPVDSSIAVDKALSPALAASESASAIQDQAQ